MSTPPDDRTVLAPSTVRPATASVPAAGAPPDHALPLHTEVGGFEIRSVLGAGGFGIVYLAYDRLLQRHVALKEYMPAAFALRTADGRVCPRAERDVEAFEIGLRSFVNEARLLAQFDAPSLLKVYRFWEADGTAYMVMPYYRGPTLKQALAQAGAPMDEAALRRLLADLLDALALLHAQQCYHRDIAPDNILMADGRQPVLLDFGAARSAIGDMTQAFTAIFKQAYAPVEQIGGYASMRQGAWTDLFALASVIHFAIDGQPPPPSIGRLLNDTYVPLAQRYAGRYGHAFLAAIDGALAVKPQDRPQSVDEMRALLDGADAVPAPAAAPLATSFATSFATSAASAAPNAAPPTVTAAGATETGGMPPPASAPPGKRRWPMFAAAAIVAVGVLGLAGRYLGGGATPPASAPAPAAAAASGSGPATPPASSPDSSPPAATPLAAAPAPTASAMFDPDAALQQLVAGASPDHAVAVTLPKPQVVINRDRFGFSVHSARGGYVYVHMLANNGNDVLEIFPNVVDRDNRIAPGQTLALPRRSWVMDVTGPAGIDRFVAIVSDAPRRFPAAQVVGNDAFATFSTARLQARQGQSAANPLLGETACAAGRACPTSYGAAAFTIESVAP